MLIAKLLNETSKSIFFSYLKEETANKKLGLNMINYNPKTSSTNSILLDMILSSLLVNGTIDSDHVEKVNLHYQNKHNVLSNSYSSKSIDETFSINSKYKRIGNDKSEISRKLDVFLVNFLSTQEYLGEEFSKILFDDIFDLYQS